MKIYLLYGPQGSGKSTQAKLLAEKLGLTLVSTGEISRELARSDPKIKELVDAGEPTPQEIIVPAVEEILEKNKHGRGFVFDGYPRYAQQIESLVASITNRGWDITRVVVLVLSQEEGIKRILLRAKIEGRQDDTQAAIARRLELYRQQTEPITSYFRRLGKVVEIDGRPAIEQIFQDICQKLALDD